jgi:serine/threonine-protein kinase RsbW
MIANGTNQTQDRLALQSRLSEIAQVPAWTEDLAFRYAIPGDVHFAMDLCLEEILSNIVRHGYAGEQDRPVIVNFSKLREGYFVIVVEDEAPYFNPLDAPELPMVSPDEPKRTGGQGIRLVRQFANDLAYEPTPTGNRLRLGFTSGDCQANPKQDG